jgi:IS5 family transposase
MKNILLKNPEVKFPIEVLEKLIDKDSLLTKVEAIVNWKEIKHLLETKVERGSAKAGQKPYSSLLLFKVLLLQRWYNLSDAKVEEAIKTRIDFMWFTNFGLANENLMYPDETTICRFRNQIVKAGIEEELLKIINRTFIIKFISHCFI